MMRNINCFLSCLILLFTSGLSNASSGSIGFSLEAIANNSNTTNSWSIVIPNFLITNNVHFKLLDGKGLDVQAKFYLAAKWPHKSKTIYIRSLVVGTKSAPKTSEKYTLIWSREKAENIVSTPYNQAMSYNAKLSAEWLSKTFYAPMLSIKENKHIPWFDEAYQGYARFVTNENTTKEREVDLTRASIWLYDRTLALYLLYLKTGNLKWKQVAHESAVFYQKNLDKSGGFKLKSGDMKYSNSQGLIFDYLFYPNAKTQENIYLIYQKTLNWPVKIKSKGFWTERHHSIALSSAITYWALTGDDTAATRIQKFINEMAIFIDAPYNQNCLSHPFESHEGWSLATSVCSPWMSALIIEQLWRYHHLTLDFKSIFIIERYTQFLTGRANFKYSFKEEVTTIPKYLVYLASDLTRKEDAWMDYQHSCDVASAISKGVYVKALLGKDSKQASNILNLMLPSCFRSMFRGHGESAWPIAPIRKFNWWFSFSGSFTWLLKYHDISYTADYVP